jgi:hypothetical protein
MTVTGAVVGSPIAGATQPAVQVTQQYYFGGAWQVTDTCTAGWCAGGGVFPYPMTITEANGATTFTGTIPGQAIAGSQNGADTKFTETESGYVAHFDVSVSSDDTTFSGTWSDSNAASGTVTATHTACVDGCDAPEIDSIQESLLPNPITGGNTVVINGHNFENPSYTLESVVFDVDDVGDQPLIGLNPQVLSDTQITVTAPDAETAAGVEPDLATTVRANFSDDSTGTPRDVIAAVGEGGNNDYLFGEPTIDDVTPSQGPTKGGTLVTIIGAGFKNPFLKLHDVTFDDGDDETDSLVATNGVVHSDTEIYVNAPSAVAVLAGGTSLKTEVQAIFDNEADSFPLLADATSALSDGYLYGSPEITSISPPGGALEGGDTITINGSGFADADLTLTGVSFVPSGGGANLPGTDFHVDSDDEITVTTPDATSAADGAATLMTKVTATFDDSSGNGTPILDSSPVLPSDNQFTFGQPVVDAVSAPSGALVGGQTVTITGSGFMTPGLTFQKVQFQNDETGDLSPTSTDVISNTEIQVVTPDATAMASPASTLSTYVVVEYLDSSTSQAVNSAPKKTGSDDFTFGAPVIDAADPLTGPLLGDQRIIITGSGFENNAGLELTGVDFIPTDGPDEGQPVPGIDPAVIDDGDIAVTTPDMTSAAAGSSSVASTVQITFEDTGTSTNVKATPAASGDDSYYFGTPTITSVAPVAGKLTGGNEVVITGTGFENPDLTLQGVGFDPVSDTDGSDVLAGTGTQVVSDTEITVATPDATSAAAGGATVSTNVLVTFDDDQDPSTTVEAKPETSAEDSYVFGAPVIDSVSPTTGSTTGGNTVTITGSGFEDPNLSLQGVTFDPVSDTDGSTALTATDANVLSDTEMTVTSPDPGSELTSDYTLATRVDVAFDAVDDSSDVVNAEATSAATDTYTYGAPEISAVSPAAGPVDGGNTVTITGDGLGDFEGGFVLASFVANGSTVAEVSATIVSGTELTLTAPNVSAFLGSSSTLDTEIELSMSNYNDTVQQEAVPASQGDNDYQFGSPVVTSVAPVSGPIKGGQTVAITGSGFLNPDLTLEGVKFDPTGDADGTEALSASKVEVVSDTEIRVVTPDATAAAGGKPSIATTVEVDYEDTASDTQLSAASQQGENAYDYGSPVVDAISPGGGLLTGGNKVTVTGSGFKDPGLKLSGVSFDPVGNNGPGANLSGLDGVVVSDTKITVTAPDATGAAAGLDDLATTVEVSFEDTADADATVHATPSLASADDYEFGAPIIDSVSPSGGKLSGGDTLTITGSGFSNPDLEFNGVQFAVPGEPLTSLATGLATVVSDTKITVTTPDATKLAEGASTLNTTVKLQFLNTDGENNYDAPAFTGVDDYVFGGPTIDSVSPAAGSIAGGNVLTIKGSGFDDPELSLKDVDFAPVGAGVDAKIVSNTEITVTTPDAVAAAKGKPSLDSTVVVAFAGAEGAAFPATASTVGGNEYIFGAPVVTSVSPASGALKGGNTVTITGTGFKDPALSLDDVSFDVGGAANPTAVLPGTHPVIVSSTEITVTAPNGTSAAKGAPILHTTVVVNFTDTNEPSLELFVHDTPAATGVDEYDFASGSVRPSITTGATATAVVGSSFAFTIRSSGYPDPAISVKGLPSGLTLKTGEGVATIGGKPKKDGRYTLAVTATNTAGKATQALRLTVAMHPAITSAAHATAAVGKAFRFKVEAEGYPAPTIAATGLPTGLTLKTSKGTTTISGDPKKAGTYKITITARNNYGEASQNFTLTVK